MELSESSLLRTQQRDAASEDDVSDDALEHAYDAGGDVTLLTPLSAFSQPHATARLDLTARRRGTGCVVIMTPRFLRIMSGKGPRWLASA